MEVWCSRAPCRATQRDHLINLYSISWGDEELGCMTIHRLVSLCMAYQDVITVDVISSRRSNHPRSSGSYIRVLRDGYIYTLVSSFRILRSLHHNTPFLYACQCIV